MTSAPPGSDPDTEPFRRIGGGSHERRRAAVVLAVLAVAAVILVVVMSYALGGSDTPTGKQTIGRPPGPAVSVIGSSTPPRTQSKPPATQSAPVTSDAPTTPRSGPVSCPTSAPCSLPDDVGDVVTALNDYRAAHGRDAVTGAVTDPARQCAVSSGNDCPSDFFWEPVGRSGAEVIKKIAANGDGTSWLLDKTMTSVEVGWAYVPSSKSFECALVAKHG